MERRRQSYRQGRIVDFRTDPKDGGRVVFKVRSDPTPKAWPKQSGHGEKAYHWQT
jgi:hypothetical protein